MRGSKYHYKRAIIGPPAKRHLMVFRWQADDGPTLNAGLVAMWFFKESWPVFLRNPVCLWFFCGVRTPCPPPPWIRAWQKMSFNVNDIDCILSPQLSTNCGLGLNMWVVNAYCKHILSHILILGAMIQRRVILYHFLTTWMQRIGRCHVIVARNKGNPQSNLMELSSEWLFGQTISMMPKASRRFMLSIKVSHCRNFFSP